METEIYTIKTENFEGPFHLLLSLIEKKKFFINDLSLAQVTKDYLNYVNKIKIDESLSKDKQASQVSSFIVVAATLILIKSKSLLPNLTLTSEEEKDISNLEDRLKLYELYIKLSTSIKKNFGKKIIFAPLERKNNLQTWSHTTIVFLPDDKITKENMMTFALNALGKIPKKISLPKVGIEKVISMEEMINKLTNRIQESIKMNFKDFSGVAKTREEKVVVIIGFLAMLELVRQGILHAVQDDIFEDIIIERQKEIV